MSAPGRCRAAAAAAALGLAAAPAVAQGLPQLDSSTFAPQIIWLAISFAVLYVAMSRIVLPRIGEVLDERQNKIDGLLKRAETLKLEAESALAAYDKAMAKARLEAQDAMRQSADRAAKTAADRHAELASRLGEEIKAAEARINDAKNRALAAIGPAAADIAGAIVGRLAGETLDARALTPAVDAILRERRR